jgi:hypothetical protein
MKIGEQPLPLFSLSLNNKGKNLLDKCKQVRNKGETKGISPMFPMLLTV